MTQPANPTATWSALVSAALIGTDRAALPPAETPDASADPATALLDRAALLTAARRAGRKPGHAEPLAPAPDDDRPLVSRAAGRRLARLTSEPSPDMLAEWLDAACARGLQPPPEQLPALLDTVGRVVATRALARRLVAANWPRAAWLAALNPAWAALNTRTDEDSWKFGNTAARRNYLSALRARDPKAARKLAAAEWDRASAAERMMLLSAMDEGLGPADEPLLEAALEDRAPDVHVMAAYLLSQLPGSELGERMAARAAACVMPRSAGLPQRPYLAVAPPAAFDAAMRRDGIPPRPATARARRLGDQAHWLLEIVARTPLRAWTERLVMPAHEIVNLKVQNDWAAVLFAGWVRAATLQRDVPWAGALLNHALAWRMPMEALEADALTQLAHRADPALGAPGAAVRPVVDAPPELHAVASILRFRYQMHKELDE